MEALERCERESSKVVEISLPVDMHHHANTQTHHGRPAFLPARPSSAADKHLSGPGMNDLRYSMRQRGSRG